MVTASLPLLAQTAVRPQASVWSTSPPVAAYPPPPTNTYMTSWKDAPALSPCPFASTTLTSSFHFYSGSAYASLSLSSRRSHASTSTPHPCPSSAASAVTTSPS